MKYIDAIRIETGTEAKDGMLDPNSASQATIAGWLMGRGFTDFHVHGEESPFGIELGTPEGPVVAEPGDFIVQDETGAFHACRIIELSPPRDEPRRPWTLEREEDGTLSLRAAVYQAVGGASAAWEHLRGAGTFDDVQAREVAEALLAELVEAHAVDVDTPA